MIYLKSGLQETCADALDCDAVLTSLFNDLLLYHQSNPTLHRPDFDPAAITAEKDAVSRCHNFGSSVCFRLLQTNNVTTLCSIGSEQDVDVADIINAVDHCCANVERAERELLQPRPRLTALCFMRAAFFSACFPRRFSRPNALRLSRSCMSRCFQSWFLPSFFRRVGCGTPTTPRLLHHRHVCLLTCSLGPFTLSSLQVSRFPRRRCPNFATAGTVAAGNDFALLGCITASRCGWQACTVSIDKFSHQSML